MRWIHDEVDGARYIVHIEHLAPVRATVGGFEDAALGVVGIDVPHRRGVDHIGVVRIDDDLRDCVRIFEARIVPRFAGVDRLVHAVAGDERVADIGFTGADVDGPWV